MIRLVGAPEGAQGGESRILICRGLLWRLGMNNFCCSCHVLVSCVPRQASSIAPHTPLGKEPTCLSQLINLSLVAGPGTVSLHRCDIREECKAQSCSLPQQFYILRGLGTATSQQLDKAPPETAPTRLGTPALPPGTASSALCFSSCKLP